MRCVGDVCSIRRWCIIIWWLFFFQAEDGIRDLVRSRGLGDVYKRQIYYEDYMVVDPGNTPLQRGQLLTEVELREAEEQYLSLIHI